MRTPFTVEFSVNMRVPLADCVVSSDREVMMGNAYWTPMNMPPVYASAVDETTFCRVLQLTWMAPLSGGSPEVALLR